MIHGWPVRVVQMIVDPMGEITSVIYDPRDQEEQEDQEAGFTERGESDIDLKALVMYQTKQIDKLVKVISATSLNPEIVRSILDPEEEGAERRKSLGWDEQEEIEDRDNIGEILGEIGETGGIIGEVI